LYLVGYRDDASPVPAATGDAHARAGPVRFIDHRRDLTRNVGPALCRDPELDSCRSEDVGKHGLQGTDQFRIDLLG
jgi:hypothetical protein